MGVITIDTEAGPARGYLALPAGGRGPGVLVMHAWWGLNEAFTGVADRLAAEGFVALAPDLYQGRIAKTIDEAKGLREQLDMPKMEATARAAVGVLQARPGVQPDKLGAMGFSMGGEWSGLLSEWYPEVIRALVLVYGAAPAEFGAARAAVQGHFAEADEWESLDYVREMEEAMRAAGREVTLHIYPGVGHRFFEPNRPDVYNSAASALVWERTLAFQHDKLGSQRAEPGGRSAHWGYERDKGTKRAGSRQCAAASLKPREPGGKRRGGGSLPPASLDLAAMSR